MTETLNDTEFLTTGEVAKKLRVSVRCVAIWTREGRLPAWRAGHRWLIKREDLEQFVAPPKAGKR
jgi:excisionase family DNA binding protein